MYTYYSVVPPLANSRLGKLERPSSRISCCSGDQVTQGRPLRPRVPGPPSSPKLLNEQVLKRKLRCSLSRVISFQVDWNHQQGVEDPLKLILLYLESSVESRSTGYQPKDLSERLCRARLPLRGNFRIQAMAEPRWKPQGDGFQPEPWGEYLERVQFLWTMMTVTSRL